MSSKDPVRAQCPYSAICCKCGKYHHVADTAMNTLCFLPCEYQVYQCLINKSAIKNLSSPNALLFKACDCPCHNPQLKTTNKACGYDLDTYSIDSIPRYSKDYDQSSTASSDFYYATCPRCCQSLQNCGSRNTSCAGGKVSCPNMKEICPHLKTICPVKKRSYPVTNAGSPCMCRSFASTKPPPNSNTGLTSSKTTENVCTCFKQPQTADEEIMVVPLMDTKEVMVVDSATKLKRFSLKQKCKPKCPSVSMENVKKCCKCNKPTK